MIDFEPHATIEWQEELNAVHIKWKNLYMPIERFLQICGVAVEMVLEKQATVWLADQSESEGVFSKQIKDAIANGGEGMRQLGITQLLTILPQEAGLSSLNTRSWVKGIKREKTELVVLEFPTLEVCKTWILNNKS